MNIINLWEEHLNKAIRKKIEKSWDFIWLSQLFFVPLHQQTIGDKIMIFNNKFN